MPDKKTTYPIVILTITIILFATIFLLNKYWNFLPIGKNYLPTQDLIEGRELANAYCTRCHIMPEPDLLPKQTWLSETLPAMAPMLGITSHHGMAYDTTKTPHQPENYFPSEQLLSNDEWQKILDYYEYVAPDQLPPAAQHQPKIITDSLYFYARTPEYPHQSAPITSAVKLDPGNKLIFAADANTNRFMVFDKDLELKHEYPIDSPISDFQFLDDRHQEGKRNFLITYIGYMNPSDSPLGSVVEGWYNPETGDADILSNVYKDSLVRPVESQLADLNGDDAKDLLMNEYGHLTGKLSWIENNNGFAGEKTILIDVPGCIEAHVQDMTNDGLNDIVALCAQLDQSIYLFENKGDGKFDRQKLLQFKLTAGSSSLELQDFNNDGHPDILYTSGDNADFSQIYKPYHGVYIYLNDGNHNFTQKWFYPINGAFKAVAKDFNRNGNLDIAVISYFPNHTLRPDEGFVFFKNEGDFSFTPYHHPAAKIGRWIAMDVADWTGNGYDDILLSNFSVGPLISESPFRMNWTSGPYFLLLENRADSFSGPSEQ